MDFHTNVLWLGTRATSDCVCPTSSCYGDLPHLMSIEGEVKGKGHPLDIESGGERKTGKVGIAVKMLYKKIIIREDNVFACAYNHIHVYDLHL